jgi:hypothetical protein
VEDRQAPKGQRNRFVGGVARLYSSLMVRLSPELLLTDYGTLCEDGHGSADRGAGGGMIALASEQAEGLLALEPKRRP